MMSFASTTSALARPAHAAPSLDAVQVKKGCWPVMLTPFDAQSRVDYAALDALTQWYLAGNAQGLFACCLSSEMFQLTAEERLAVVRRVVAAVKGRVPVIASGAFTPQTTEADATGSPQALADAAHRVAETGAAAVVFTTNQFAAPAEGEDVFVKNVEDTLALLDAKLPLGLYECPVPYKRLLQPSSIRRLAQTGRFRFLKDTCCNLAQIREKIDALRGTPMHFYNANTATLLGSLQAGGDGFSGVGANAIPHLYAWISENAAAQPDTAREVQAFLDATSPVVDHFYSYSVKHYLSRFGVPMGTVCRNGAKPLPTDAATLNRFEVFHGEIAVWEKRLGLVSPFTKIVS